MWNPDWEQLKSGTTRPKLSSNISGTRRLYCWSNCLRLLAVILMSVGDAVTRECDGDMEGVTWRDNITEAASVTSVMSPLGLGSVPWHGVSTDQALTMMCHLVTPGAMGGPHLVTTFQFSSEWPVSDNAFKYDCFELIHSDQIRLIVWSKDKQGIPHFMERRLRDFHVECSQSIKIRSHGSYLW